MLGEGSRRAQRSTRRPVNYSELTSGDDEDVEQAAPQQEKAKRRSGRSEQDEDYAPGRGAASADGRTPKRRRAGVSAGPPGDTDAEAPHTPASSAGARHKLFRQQAMQEPGSGTFMDLPPEIQQVRGAAASRQDAGMPTPFDRPPDPTRLDCCPAPPRPAPPRPAPPRPATPRHTPPRPAP